MTEDKTPKPTPLELLKRRQSPIFDVVHGTDNPGRKPERKSPPQQKESAVKLDGRSMVKDIIPARTLHSLQTLHWRLERAQNTVAKRKARDAARKKKPTTGGTA